MDLIRAFEQPRLLGCQYVKPGMVQARAKEPDWIAVRARAALARSRMERDGLLPVQASR